MTVFHLQRLNRTRATSSWSDELLMIASGGASGNGQIFPTASRGLFANFDGWPTFNHVAELVKSFVSLKGSKVLTTSATKPVANCLEELFGNRSNNTLASRPFLARRFQLNQGALSPVEVDRACDARSCLLYTSPSPRDRG